MSLDPKTIYNVQRSSDGAAWEEIYISGSNLVLLTDANGTLTGSSTLPAAITASYALTASYVIGGGGTSGANVEPVEQVEPMEQVVQAAELVHLVLTERAELMEQVLTGKVVGRVFLHI